MTWRPKEGEISTEMFGQQVGGGSYTSYQDIANQKKVLLSYDLVEEAVLKLDYQVEYFIRGRVKVEEQEKTP